MFVGMSDELAYCIGVYLGDGFVSKRNKFGLSVKDEDFADKFKQSVEIVTGWSVNKYRETRKDGHVIYQITVGSKSLCDFLKKTTKSKTVLPFDLIKGHERPFLLGVIDSEGSIVRLWNKTSFNVNIAGTEKWFLKLGEILTTVGIKHWFKKYFRKDRGYYEYRYNVNARSYKESNLSFSIERKRKLLDEVK